MIAIFELHFINRTKRIWTIGVQQLQHQQSSQQQQQQQKQQQQQQQLQRHDLQKLF